MSNLIEKLAVQSLVNVGGELIFSKEKFAELIVLEATDIVYGLLDDNTGAEVVVRVKEHFGVE